MQIVIDIPGEIRKGIFDGVYCGIKDKRVSDAIKNGIPLEEGHGRLIDADELGHCLGEIFEDIYFKHLLEDAPTIIEADEG